MPRFHFYSTRSGYLYAALSYIGRTSFPFWRLVAPLFTRHKIRAWLARQGPHILNLGGGGNTFDRWLTADVDPRADVYVDLTRTLPFPNASVDVVYLEEVVEHLSQEQGTKLLTECHRILNPDGLVRLTTPDLGAFVSQFDNSVAFETKFNHIFYQHGHRHIYSKEGISTLLSQTGFADISTSSFRDMNSRYGYFDTHPLRFSISDSTLTQYWDARKIEMPR